MLDVAVSYHRYKFIGHEFLTWLWYVIENEQEVLKASGDDFVSLEIGNRLVLENRLPGNPPVNGLPYTTGRYGHVDGVALATGPDGFHVSAPPTDIRRTQELPVCILQGG